MNREGAPSAAAQEWYVNTVQEPMLLAGLNPPVVTSFRALSRMDDFDAGASAEREAILREIEEIEAAGIRPTDPQGFFLSGHDAMDTLKQRILARKEGA